MSIMRSLEAAAVIIAIVGAVFTIFWFMDERHESTQRSNISYTELKAELLDRDIKKDAESRVYYKDIELEKGSLGIAEQRRLEYLEEQLERKYDDQRLIQQTLSELKREK